MDSSKFDALTRRLRSRRFALAGLLGGVVAILGGAREEASAHNPAAACKKINDPKKRRRCLRRARRHRRRKHACKPKPRAVICKNRCDTVRTCKRKVGCTCPVGKTCLVNSGCNRSCAVFGIPGDCPAGCACVVFLREAPTTRHCYPSTIENCEQVPLPCVTSANCPRGFFCGVTGCDGVGAGRCIPNCPF